MFSRLAILFAFTIIYTNGATIKPEDQRCGMMKEGGLVHALDSSKQAGLGEFPWTAAIVKEKDVICAGSLIEPNVVLTAGNCLKGLKKEDIKVKLGLWDLNNRNEKYRIQEKLVSQIIQHPEFVQENITTKHDIALLVLNTPVQLEDHIALACLAKKNHEEKSKKCYVAGWGKETKDKKKVTILKKLLLPIVPKEECEKKLKEKIHTLSLNDKIICAGGDTASTCQGDGGAALVCQMEPEAENKNRFIQSGITSWGVGCVNELPGVFTNVAKYREWIDEQINKLGLDTKYYTA